jgi:DNA modification methylase
MRPIVVEACRVSKGLAVFNVSDVVRDFRYQNGPEWLHADLTRLDGLDAIRPYIWVKSGPGFDDRGNGQPGSGGKHYHRNDYEPVYGYARPENLPPPWTDNTAFGLPPKYEPGGEMSHRNKQGKRRTIIGTPRKPDGTREKQTYRPPLVSNPGNVIRERVGGRGAVEDLSYQSEAPMPLGVAERFIAWYVPPQGIVLDPFCGSGTTIKAALKNNRRGVGCDLRSSQIELADRRIMGTTLSLFDSIDEPTPEAEVV